MTDPVMAAYRWRTNGVLVKMIATRLGPDGTGYLKPTDRIIDPTYGDGKWHTEWTPGLAVDSGVWASDLYKNPPIPNGTIRFQTGVDFRNLPHPDGWFDAGYWDPTYAPQGGRSTSTIGRNLAAYGRDTVASTPKALHAVNADGFREILRVIKPRGPILAKCMNYVWSGRLHLARHDFATLALELGCTIEEELTHLNNGSPQDKNRTKAAECPACEGSGIVGEDHGQGNIEYLGCPDCEGTGKIEIPSVQHHARNNSSTMYVLRAPK